jgi:hypothetical protein
MKWLTRASDGKQVSIEGAFCVVRHGPRDADNCHSWFCVDSSMREGRGCGSKVIAFTLYFGDLLICI